MDMVFHVIILLLISTSFYSVSAFGTNHICNGTKTEPAGLKGTVYLEADCFLTLTGITGKINIQGISDSLCDGDQQLSVNSVNYFANQNATGTVVVVSGNELVIKTIGQPHNFELQYYHGKMVKNIDTVVIFTFPPDLLNISNDA